MVKRYEMKQRNKTMDSNDKMHAHRGESVCNFWDKIWRICGGEYEFYFELICGMERWFYEIKKKWKKAKFIVKDIDLLKNLDNKMRSTFL